MTLPGALLRSGIRSLVCATQQSQLEPALLPHVCVVCAMVPREDRGSLGKMTPKESLLRTQGRGFL